MATPAGELALLLILLSAVLIFFAWWARRLRKGIRLQLWAVALFGLFYVLFFLVVEAEVLRLPWGIVARAAGFFDVLLLLLGAIPAYRYTAQTTVFERSASGRWMYRGRFAIPVLWLAFFLLRYGVELALLGRVYLFTPTPGHAVSIPTFAVALIVVDALFAASTGLVMGNALGIYSAYRRQRAQRPGPGGATASIETAVPPRSGANSR
ncbi:MAG: hypothetical protein WCB18_07975 [Thermoplasmata archaeon]